jgi:hypothetical protein
MAEISSEKVSSKEKSINDQAGANAPIYTEPYEAGFVQEYTPVKDGIELHPKPTADLLDPLNFPKWQKWTALGIVMWM